MSEHSLATPVALFIYNRPHPTERVFAEIRRSRPRQLLVVADGPAASRPGDAEMCAAARALIARVDWKCELKTQYSEINLGCRRRMSTGLDWVFRTVDRAIILEDDCLPHPTFFTFCHELLEKYAHVERIGGVSGNNFNQHSSRRPYSYAFSMYPLTWGWASWARAWMFYDAEMTQWPLIRDGGWLKNLLDDPASVRYWNRIFQKSYQGDIDTWDYQWTFSCWVNGLVTIHPAVNLVSNIGFDGKALHTQDPTCRRANYPAKPMEGPLSHPPFIIRDVKGDHEIKKAVHGIYPLGGTFVARAARGIRRLATWPLRKNPDGGASST